MQWLIKTITKKLREDVALAAWVGVDSLADVKVYHAEAPGLDVLSDTDEAFRYIVFHTNIGGGAPLDDYDDHLVEDWDVQFDLVDLSDGSSDHVTDGYELLKDIFEPRTTATLDDAAFPEYTTTDIQRTSPLRGPERDHRGAWRGTVDYRILAQEV